LTRHLMEEIASASNLETAWKRVKADKKFNDIVREAEEGKERVTHTQTPIDLASVKQERDRTSALRKSSTAAGHGADPEGEEQAPDHVLSPAEEKKRLAERLHDDPYVQESMAVLDSAVGARKGGPSVGGSGQLPQAVQR